MGSQRVDELRDFHSMGLNELYACYDIEVIFTQEINELAIAENLFGTNTDPQNGSFL